MADRVAELGAVERVEMEVADAAGVKLAGKLRGDRRRDQLARRRQVVEAFEHVIEPLRNGRAAGQSEAARGRDVRDRQDARDDLRIDAGRRGLVAEAEEAVRREEELRDRAVGARVDLALEIFEVEFARGGIRGGFRDKRRPKCRTARRP